MSAPRIVFIGAGSTVFARNLIRDILTFPDLHDATFALMDIDPERLAVTDLVAKRLASQAGIDIKVEATTDRRAALRGAKYVINMIQVGGYRPATVTDFEIPKKYGLRQTIADTLGIGGIMRALRTVPVLLDIAADMEELCPDALFLNYTNPMAMLTMAMNRATNVKTVGLCHSVQGTAAELARILEVPYAEIDYRCAGINHMAFYLRFEHKGEDLYPRLRQIVADNKQPAYERVRFEVFKRFGYFVTESSEHFSEYVPWFIKDGRPDLIDRYNIPLDEYPARCEDQLAEWGAMQAALTSSEPNAADRYEAERAGTISGLWTRRLAVMSKTDPRLAELTRYEISEARRKRFTTENGHAAHSGEYGSLIIHSMETGQPRVIYGNVENNDIISNLPRDAAVEVPCLIDHNGVQPTAIGALPPQLAALMQTNINPQTLTVEAALTGRRDHVYHAAMLDPHTAAELDLEQIVSLIDDLVAAHGNLVPALT